MMALAISWLLWLSVSAALLLAASWLAVTLLRRATAAARHQIWALGVTGALLLPLLCCAVPSLPLSSEVASSDAGHSVLATAVVLTGGQTTAAEPTWPSWLGIAWLMGALLVSLRFLRGHLAAHRLWRGAEPAHAQTWLSARREAAAALGIAEDVDLGRSEAIGSPMTIGVLTPRVLLPAAADSWSPERLRAVLTHELGHVRRRDALIQLCAQLVCVVHWPNPLAWLAAARLRIEREYACDDLVLGAGIRPSSYAADLLDVVRGLSNDEVASAGAVSMIDSAGTEARLRRILDSAAPRRPLGARFRLTAWAATLGIAVLLASTSRFALSGDDVGEEANEREVPLRGVLSLGEPSLVESPNADPFEFYLAEGALELSHVEKEVRRHLGDLQQCYERRLLVNPELSGEVLIHWTIAATGEVTEQCITHDTVGDADVLACVNELVSKSRFPASSGPVNVSFPFVFAASP